MNNLIKLFVLICVVLTAIAAEAKVRVPMNEYYLAEVNTDDVNIRTGPGTNYPKAYSIFTEFNGRKSKSEVMPAYKGQRFFVKPSGDWCEIHTLDTFDTNSKRYISKKFIDIIETEPFDCESIKSPQVWGYAEKIMYGDEGVGGEELLVVTIVTIYPEGLVITQNYTPEGDAIKIGTLAKDGNAVRNVMSSTVGTTGNEVPKDTPLKLWAQSDSNPPCLMWEFGENTMSPFVFNGENVGYTDVSNISPERWGELVKELRKSDNYRSIRLFRTNPDIYFTKNDLSKFVRIK